MEEEAVGEEPGVAGWKSLSQWFSTGGDSGSTTLTQMYPIEYNFYSIFFLVYF